MNARFFLMAGIVFMLLAVITGAFGAHALKSMLSAHHASIWQTATEYQFYHALGLIGLGIWADKTGLDKWVKFSGLCLILGISIFSGSLYTLALTGIAQLGIATPIGGVLFILGWVGWLLSVVLINND